MEQKSLSKPIENRLLSYQRQAKQYANSYSKIPKTTKLRRNTLMALVPLAASSMLPAGLQAQCSFSQTFPITATGQYFTIDLTNGVGDDQFIIKYSNTSGGFKRLGVEAVTSNAVQLQVLGTGGSAIGVIPRLMYGASINTTNFVSTTDLAIYSASGGSITASPPTPLSYPEYIAIRSGDNYGFLTISISGGVLTVVGGIDMTKTTAGHIDVGDCSTLPVELISFEAQAEEDLILLEWQTATEINNLGFELQRSMDGTNFQKIGWLNGHGTTAEAQNYHFKDEKVLSNELYYYRLMQVDVDGSSTYSKIITAKLKGKAVDLVGNIYPNPVHEQLTIPITLLKERQVHVILFDGQGKIVKNKIANLTEGTNELVLDMQDIEAGNYFAKIQLETQIVYRKIIKI